MTKTAGIEFIRNEMYWDKYDPWASVMGALSDLSEAWYGFSDECLPGYRPSPLFKIDDWETERTARLYGAMVNGIVTESDVTYWYQVLDRMYGLVILAGRDY